MGDYPFAATIGNIVPPLPVADGGTGETAAAAAFANLAPLTTEGDLLYENATPAPARLPIGAVNTMLSSSGSLPEWTLGLQLQAATAVAGYTLVNGTGNIISWTAPNDGNLHRAIVMSSLKVTSNETGGQIGATSVDPASGSAFNGLYAANQAAGSYSSNAPGLILGANQAVAVEQATALTGGAAVLWAEIWGS